MKWFMPPMPFSRSRMQAETQEPSTVTSTMSVVVTKVFARQHLDRFGIEMPVEVAVAGQVLDETRFAAAGHRAARWGARLWSARS